MDELKGPVRQAVKSVWRAMGAVLYDEVLKGSEVRKSYCLNTCPCQQFEHHKEQLFQCKLICLSLV